MNRFTCPGPACLLALCCVLMACSGNENDEDHLTQEQSIAELDYREFLDKKPNFQYGWRERYSEDYARKYPDEADTFKQTRTSIAEIRAYAKAMASKRDQLKLAQYDPEVRPKYAQAFELMEQERYQEAEAILLELAEQRYADAEYSLSAFYGRHGEQLDMEDPLVTRIAWMERAIEQGYAKAQYSYGIWHSLDRFKPHLPKDHALYVDWIHIAAEQGHPDAQGQMGSFYRHGDGVDPNYIESYKWYTLAMNRHNKPPEGEEITTLWRYNAEKSARQQLVEERSLTPEQVSKAEALAAEWEASHPYAYQSVNELAHFAFSRPDEKPIEKPQDQ